MTIDLIIEELRATLEKASGGEWQEGHNWVFIDPIDPERNPTHALRSILRDVSEDELQANVRHIVAAQPDNIRALLTEIESLREALREIANEDELHTKLSQVRLCCKFQDIAALTNASQKEGGE